MKEYASIVEFVLKQDGYFSEAVNVAASLAMAKLMLLR